MGSKEQLGEQQLGQSLKEVWEGLPLNFLLVVVRVFYLPQIIAFRLNEVVSAEKRRHSKRPNEPKP